MYNVKRIFLYIWKFEIGRDVVCLFEILKVLILCDKFIWKIIIS